MPSLTYPFCTHLRGLSAVCQTLEAVAGESELASEASLAFQLSSRRRASSNVRCAIARDLAPEPLVLRVVDLELVGSRAAELTERAGIEPATSGLQS